MIAGNRTHAIEWSQLNKGTHEEDKPEEFEKAIVKEIFDLIVQNDDAVKNGGAFAPDQIQRLPLPPLKQNNPRIRM